MTYFLFKNNSDDFIVEEILKKELTWKWDYLYLYIQKKDKTTFELIQHLSKILSVPKREINFAWLKDKSWITTQWLSIHKKYIRQKNLSIFLDKNLWKNYKLISLESSKYPLNIWDNLWNNFKLSLYNNKKLSKYEIENKIKKIIEELKNNWFPNYYWAQRFWLDNKKWTIWKDFILWKISKRLVFDLWRKELKFKVQAFSSYLFNCYLKLRQTNNILNTKIDWDVIIDWKITWPVYWYDLRLASDKALQLEKKVLIDNWINLSDLIKYKEIWVFWIRRNLTVIPWNILYNINDAWDVFLRFSLPTWAYASSLYWHIESLMEWVDIKNTFKKTNNDTLNKSPNLSKTNNFKKSNNYLKSNKWNKSKKIK